MARWRGGASVRVSAAAWRGWSTRLSPIGTAIGLRYRQCGAVVQRAAVREVGRRASMSSLGDVDRGSRLRAIGLRTRQSCAVVHLSLGPLQLQTDAPDGCRLTVQQVLRGKGGTITAPRRRSMDQPMVHRQTIQHYQELKYTILHGVTSRQNCRLSPLSRYCSGHDA